MNKNTDAESWLNSEEERAEDQIKQGKEITNPLAAKDVRKTGSKKKKTNPSSNDYNYLRILLPPEVENRFRYLLHVREGQALKKGIKEPTMGHVFEEMVALLENDLNIKQ